MFVFSWQEEPEPGQEEEHGQKDHVHRAAKECRRQRVVEHQVPGQEDVGACYRWQYFSYLLLLIETFMPGRYLKFAQWH